MEQQLNTVGRRKASVARVYLSYGTGKITINKRDVKEVFSDNYPKSGVSYEVQSGDTLSQIAVQFGSSVEYIQNANQINDPARDLLVGDIIFIPLTEE